MEKLSSAMLVRIKSNLDQDIIFMRGMAQTLEFYRMEKKAEADKISSERRSGKAGVKIKVISETLGEESINGLRYSDK